MEQPVAKNDDRILNLAILITEFLPLWFIFLAIFITRILIENVIGPGIELSIPLLIAIFCLYSSYLKYTSKQERKAYISIAINIIASIIVFIITCMFTTIGT